MKRYALILAALSIAAAAADLPLITMVPDTATVIGGIHVDSTANTLFGAYVLSQVNGNDPDFQNMITATGFDPRRDLRELVFASVGQAKGPGLVLARGVFNGPQILAAAKSAKAGGIVTSYNGIDILENAGKTRTSALAFANGSLAIAGDSALVRAAIDRVNGATPGTLATKATTASASYDAWIVTNGSYNPAVTAAAGSTKAGGLAGAAGPALQSIVETSGGLTFGSVVRFNGEALTRSDKDAQALVDVTKFLASLIQMNGPGNAEFQKLQPFLDSLVVKASGSSVQFSASINETDLENLIQMRKRAKSASVR